MKLFLMDPSRPYRIIEVEAEIKVCDKTAWAILPQGERRLLGATAFFTLSSAERAQLGALQKIVANTYLQGYKHDIWKGAKALVEKHMLLSKGKAHA